jgi:hypothetical protein
MLRELKDRRKPGPRLADRIMLRLSTAEHVDGLWIGAFDQPTPMLHRLREALQLIKTYDPFRYARLTRDLKRVWVCDSPSPIGCFNCRLDACQLNGRFVLASTTTPELLASVLVHEGTHARLWSYGIGYDEALRPRVEAICVRRQLAFAKKLPNGQQSREWARETLTACDPANLSNASFSKRNYDWYIEEAHRLGIPDRVLRAVLALRRLIWAVIRFTRWATRGFVAPANR